MTPRKSSKSASKTSKLETSQIQSETKPDSKRDSSNQSKVKKKKESSDLSGAKIIAVNAGRLKKNKKKKRYKFGPKKGERMTSSDESVNELNINTTDWSSSSLDEYNLPVSEHIVKPILARGPLPPPKGWTGK